MAFPSIRTLSLAALLLAPLILSACSSDDDEENQAPVTGDRIPVLQSAAESDTDSSIATTPVRLPLPFANPDWPLAGGYASHAMHHLDLAPAPRQVWTASIGDGSSGDAHLMSPPVTDGRRIFTLDIRGTVKAFSTKSGMLLWSVSTNAEDLPPAVASGGIAYYGNRLFISSGYAQVISLNADNGKEVWRQNTPAPLRAPPTVSGDRVYVVTVENATIALQAVDGVKLWAHNGITESAGLLGGSSPAVASGIVISAYTSGELFALRAESGRVAWSETLSKVQRADAVSALADIRGRPVIDRGLVFAISHSGRISAVDLRSGDRIWDRDIAGEQEPWVAGDFVYVLSTRGELYCLLRDTGLVRWMLPLPRFENPKEERNPITWAGPVLAGDRLIVAGSNHDSVAVSPYTGEIIGRQELPGPVLLSPIVADRTLYFLTDEGDLVAFR